LPQRIICRAAMSRALAAALLAFGCVILAGCTVGSLGDHLPTAAGGLPENTPARPAPAAYPAVHDMPPPRSDNVLTDEERKKLEDDLIAARKRNTAGNTGGVR
jgi:hypothetical protein